MRVLVCSNDNMSNDPPVWEHARSRGIEVHSGPVGTEPWRPDAVIGLSVTLMDQTFLAATKYPSARLYCYNWDVYEWVWEPGFEGKVQARHDSRLGEYDYVRYGELLRLANEVWVPSNCTGYRTRQWYPRSPQWHRILSACPWWDHDNVRDEGYALCCLREIPDPHWGLLERACRRVGVPLKMTRHGLTEREYRDAVAGCRFICAPLYELSTGGLSLLEAYYLGKPVLISDSEWNGGADYFGDRATYFQAGSEDRLASAIEYMYGRHAPYHADHREWIVENYSDRRMADDILARLGVE